MTDTFFTIPADSKQVATRNWRSCRVLFDKSLGKGVWKTDYMQYGVLNFTIAAADGLIHSTRYCVPMDNQRPELDLRFFDDICPDKNGTLS